jgi:enoyl-CoA hydratase/carnithine racemase
MNVDLPDPLLFNNGPIGILTLNRSGTHNALSVEMLVGIDAVARIRT